MRSDAVVRMCEPHRRPENTRKKEAGQQDRSACVRWPARGGGTRAKEGHPLSTDQ
jgi:hypothetical protein